ncbi:GNAT family N-acetyltransferase [Streptomyces sp. NPDC007983]|uniref:GNAT family N-acetyltransferase n=1 Tax=Streptomyces sp. NPDC007983 TaxID=3364800 RepID=UPI0036E2CDE9
MTSAAIELRHFRDVAPVWDTLISVYAEVRADRLHDPHYSVERYGERLARHASEPGWEAVVGYDGGEAAGYAYGNTIEHGDRYGKRVTPPPASALTEAPTLAPKEMMVRVPWRKTGASRGIHDELLARRTEEQVTSWSTRWRVRERSIGCTSRGDTRTSGRAGRRRTRRF